MSNKIKKISSIIILIVLALVILILISDNYKKYDKITYTEFNEYFSNDTEYDMLDSTGSYDLNVRRFLEAGNGKIQVFYIEFSKEKYADEYINNTYKNDKTNKIKVKKNYTYIKNTKGKYMKLYKVDNVIVIGKTDSKKYKRLVKKTLKKLGY